MTQGKERKRKTTRTAASFDSAQQGQQPPAQDLAQTVGEVLKLAREERGMTLEDVSGAIHIRVAQLRAIEDGNLEALPGMTYALGFVRSYAQFLRLNAADISYRFKAEHGIQPVKHELHMPEPLAESKVPDPVILGVAALSAVILLILWSVFSGGGDAEVAQTIPPAPVEGSAPLVAFDASAPLPAVNDAAAAAAENLAEASAPAPATAPAEDVTSSVVASAVVPAPTAAEQAPAAALAPQVEMVEVKPAEVQQVLPPEQPPAQEVINVRAGKGRVVIRAKQSSWVQVTAPGQKVVFKKVMKAGETFQVPDMRGLTLITSNAGGIDIVVDGKQAPPVGRAGEIVRGVALDANDLMRKRVRVNNY